MVYQGADDIRKIIIFDFISVKLTLNAVSVIMPINNCPVCHVIIIIIDLCIFSPSIHLLVVVDVLAQPIWSP